MKSIERAVEQRLSLVPLLISGRVMRAEGAVFFQLSDVAGGRKSSLSFPVKVASRIVTPVNDIRKSCSY